jgi:hypothetical protein
MGSAETALMGIAPSLTHTKKAAKPNTNTTVLVKQSNLFSFFTSSPTFNLFLVKEGRRSFILCFSVQPLIPDIVGLTAHRVKAPTCQCPVSALLTRALLG